MNKNIQRGLALVGAFVVSGAAMAADGPDLSPLTSSVNFSSVITAVLAISASLMTLYLAIKGARTVISMVRGK
ncbi:hypothetical protein [Undibacterium squillarum]|jgi:hypothetical protein|uniref:Phage-like membrane protein n=1 Tax=Undibacterium squillarum TaxID=1131567 RepID=A0ABQ2Y3T1_9BURK|nr:hypothetical protein [Undibacterium squillarum]GGX52149.1 phage-like membrane protein [Undibacterium squillarum]